MEIRKATDLFQVLVEHEVQVAVLALVPGLQHVSEEGRVGNWNVRKRPSGREGTNGSLLFLVFTQIAHENVGEFGQSSRITGVFDQSLVVVKGHDDVLGIAGHVNHLRCGEKMRFNYLKWKWKW